MEIMQIVGIALVATIMAVILKGQRPEMAMQISIITGIIILMLVASKVGAIVSLIGNMSTRLNIDSSFITTLLKIIGIAYIAEFGAEVCKDAGESAIASKIELAAKVMIVLLAVPIMTSLLNLIIKIMP